MEHNILPTSTFLFKRLGNACDPTCKRCGLHFESQQHLFWECNASKEIWNLVASWWSLDRNLLNPSNNSFWKQLKIYKGSKLSAVWAQVICSVLWSIWLGRNNLIFNKKKDSPQETSNLLMHRAFTWILASGWLSSDVRELWKVNPVGSILLCSKLPHDKGIIGWNPEYYAYTDGSWLEHQSGAKCSGIGGLMLDMNQNIKFVFSGPSCDKGPLEAEKTAMLYLYSNVSALISVNHRLLIYTDSMTLVTQVQKIRAGIEKAEGEEDWKELVQNAAVKLYYMPREELYGADQLAKEGRNKSFIHFSWT